jgi:hypothetical protein
MSALSSKLRSTEGNGLVFWCPGCNAAHHIQHGAGTGPRWGWNGNAEKPTFTPSVLVRNGHYAKPGEQPGQCACDFQERYPDQEPWPWPCARCHSFVTYGQIQFLSDCTHALAGQTVPLPDFPENKS